MLSKTWSKIWSKTWSQPWSKTWSKTWPKIWPKTWPKTWPKIWPKIRKFSGNVFECCFCCFFQFPAVSEVPGAFQQLREACRNHFDLSWTPGSMNSLFTNFFIICSRYVLGGVRDCLGKVWEVSSGQVKEKKRKKYTRKKIKSTKIQLYSTK